MIRAVPATPEHLPVLAATMRAAERDELAAFDLTPAQGLDIALRHATAAWAGVVGDAPVCLFGVSAPSLLSGTGAPWLLSTDGILPHQHSFLRQCRGVIWEMLQLHPRLADHVDARNHVSISWLRWIGFRVEEAIPHGLRGEPFHPFWMEA